ncbi:hypothetical protein ACWEQL_29300 [Kitasatospora sp. NPDC004240]
MRTRDVVRLMGRRQALRCLAVGALAAAAAACGGSGGGPRSRALREYASGDWEARTNGRRVAVFTIRPDGTWSADGDEMTGRWDLDKDGLTIVMDGEDDQLFLPGVSKDAAAALSTDYTVRRGRSGRPVRALGVSTDRDTVRLDLSDPDEPGSKVMTLTRRA